MVVVSSGCRIEIDIVQVDWEQKLCRTVPCSSEPC